MKTENILAAAAGFAVGLYLLKPKDAAVGRSRRGAVRKGKWVKIGSTTTGISQFGARERGMLIDILQAWEQQGLPNDFYDNEVVPMMNMNSGNVFLTNSEYQVAMMNGGKLESFYNSPYAGVEGFFEDLKNEYPFMHKEDKEWFRELAKSLRKSYK